MSPAAGRALTTGATTTESSPFERSETTRAIYRRARRDRDAAGRMILPTLLSTEERRAIEARLSHLERHLVSAKRGKIERAVSEMLSGWDKSGGDEGAFATVAQFVVVLDGLPEYAIVRACHRFARGEVQPEEIGERRLSRSFFPSTAQVRMVAVAMVTAPRDEMVVGRMLLDAVLEPEPGERDVAKVQSMHREFRKQMAEGATSDHAELERRRAENDARKIETERDARIAEYQSRGLEPVFGDAGKNLVVSLSLLLHMGWTIEERVGGNVLRKPDGTAA